MWLNAQMLSPYEYWQYWRNAEDADIGRFLKLFTVLPMDEIARLERLDGAEINDAKKVLASAATALLHGRTAAEEAAETARRTFEEQGTGDALPTVIIDQAILAGGLGLLSAFVQAGLAPSNGEVRRQVKGGAVRINDQVVTDEQMVLGEHDLSDDGVIKLSLGRKRHALLKVG